MDLVLANPWGLAALVAVPLLVAVHCLRQRSLRVRTSTLFLLDHAAPRPVGGRRLERFQGGLPFWFELAAILAATWLLVEPRWIRADSRQTIVVLLDGSVSLGAYLDETKEALARTLRRLDASAAATRWHLLDTAPGRGPLHAGDRLDDLLAALDGWRPTAGSHDVRPAVAQALSLAPADRGGTILVTDRRLRVPPGVALFSVATPIANVGFTGADAIVDEPFGAPDPGSTPAAPVAVGTDGPPSPSRWRALVTNHGTLPAARRLSLFAGDARSRPAEAAGEGLALDLAPGETRALSGEWPPGADRLLLVLDADRFTTDDVAPLERPVRRPVRVAVRGGGAGRATIAAMLAAAEGVVTAVDPAAADLAVGSLGDEEPLPAVLLPPSPAGDEALLDADPVAAADHPLVRDLAWGGLLSPPPVPIEPGAGDEVLVWKGSAPLVVLRTTILPGGGSREALLVCFDVDASTAARLPALVILLDRFAARVRDGIDRPWADTFTAEQSIRLPTRAASLVVTPAAAPPAAAEPVATPFLGRAPRTSSFFEVRDGDGGTLLTGACQQLDPREGDFAAAVAIDDVAGMRREHALQRSVADPFLPGWLALVALALVGAWWARSRSVSASARPAPAATGGT